MGVKRTIRAGVELAHETLRRMGLAAFRWQANHHYVPDVYGRSAYKHVDVRHIAPFGELAETVIGHGRTHLHYDRLYSVYQGVRHVARQVPAPTEVHLAEAGVYRGGTSYFMGAAARALGLTAAHLHCFDTFTGHAARDIRPRTDRTDKHGPGMFTDTSAEAVRGYLSSLGAVHLHVGRFQDTCDEVRALTFSFVHLDMDIYEPTLAALEFFDERLAPGGVVLLDDYGFATCPGIVEAVEVFLRSRPHYYMHHLLTGQCLLVRVAAPAGGGRSPARNGDDGGSAR